MGLLQESIGPFGQSRVDSEFFPSLAILDTEEILEQVGKKWKNPGPDRRHSIDDIDSILMGWVNFCDSAVKGHQIAVNAAKKGIISCDLESIESYLIFTRAMGEDGKDPKTIITIREAFTGLLSDTARKKIGKEKTNIISRLFIPRRLDVDENLRTKINLLVENVYQLAGFHHLAESEKLAEIDDD